jgi:hypothetical protein
MSPEAVAPRAPAKKDAHGRAKKKGTHAQGDETFHVFGSGNLGLIYVRGERERLTRRTLHERFPGLVEGLAQHPGVGFVVVFDEDGPVALGDSGWHRLDDGYVEGDDPLIPFGPDAPGFVRRVAHRPECPDIYVNSLVETGTEEVAAFEGLSAATAVSVVGRTVLRSCSRRTFPFRRSGWSVPDAMHVALRSILRHLGHRADIPDTDEGESPSREWRESGTADTVPAE